MKGFLEDLGKKIGETAESFTNKAGEVVEIQRIRNQIHTMERSNDRDFRDIGRMVYDKYKDGEVIDTEMVCICEEIEKREASVEELEQMIADVKGTVNCPDCQKPLEKDMAYCPYCGAKVPGKSEACAEETCEEESCACEQSKVQGACEEVKEAVEDAVEATVEKAEEIVETAAEKAEDAVETAAEKAEETVEK